MEICTRPEGSLHLLVPKIHIGKHGDTHVQGVRVEQQDLKDMHVVSYDATNNKLLFKRKSEGQLKRAREKGKLLFS